MTTMLQPTRALRAALLAGLATALLGPDVATAGECPEVTFGDVVNVPLAEEAETLDPSSAENLIYASAAALPWEDNLPTDELEPSLLHVILNRPDDVRLLTSVDLGIGEATSAGAIPFTNLAVVAMKDADQPNTTPGRLLLVSFAGIVGETEIPAGPDSVAVTADGRFVVIANEAETPAFPELEEYRDIDPYVETYATLAVEVSAGAPAILGLADLDALLAALGLDVAEDLLEAAVGGDLPELLTEYAVGMGMEGTEDGTTTPLDELAVSLGRADGAALLAEFDALYAEDVLVEALLAAGLIAERPADDAAGAITIVQLDTDDGLPRVVALVTAQAMFDGFFSDMPGRATEARKIEPEYAVIAPDDSYALVTLQDQSAVAVVDLVAVADAVTGEELPAPEDLGAAALLDIVLLPHGHLGASGEPAGGARPDGLSISPNGRMAITANESDSDTPHAQGISILDLTGGPSDIQAVATYSIFDLAPELLDDTGLADAPLATPDEDFPADAALLPRIDPEDTVIFEKGCQAICAVALERFEKSEDIEGYDDLPTEEQNEFGSVLILDVTGALFELGESPVDDLGRGGYMPGRLERIDVGFGKKAPKSPPRPEVVKLLETSCSIVVANEKDKGSVSLIPVLLSEPQITLTLESAGEGGYFDVLLTTDREIAGFSFGLEVDGACDSAAVVDLVPGSDLPEDVGLFTSARQEDGTAITTAAILSLSPPGPVLGPGENLRIATALVCGSVFSEEGCELVFSDSLGDPSVGVVLSTPQGDRIVPSLGAAPVPTGRALCFRRGDANGDGENDISDSIRILSYLFLGVPVLCLDACDVDDTGEVDITDAIVNFNWLFLGGPAPAAPGPSTCGPDPTEDEVGCDFYEACRDV